MRVIYPFGAGMNLPGCSIRFAIALLIVANLVGCKDLLPGTDKSDAGSSDIADNPTKTIIETDACYFPALSPPENIEVYAIDGQDWIEKNKPLDSDDSDATLIQVNVDNSRPVALLLTAKEPARWQIKSSAGTQIWGVYVTAELPQQVTGITAPTVIHQHYRSRDDKCGFYWAPEYQVHPLYVFTKKLFGKPYLEIAEVHKGRVSIQEMIAIPEQAPVMPIERNRVSSRYTTMEIPPPPPPQTVAPAKMMTITEALRANVIRPGTLSDINSFKSRYRTANNKDLGKHFDERIKHMPVYVITQDFTFPRNLAGAHAVVFILEKRVPYPNGDSEHSPMLDMNSGTCMGGICDMLTND